MGDIINVAGQIPLVPGSMLLVEGNELVQCRLALRHVQRILNAMDSKIQIRDVVQVILPRYYLVQVCWRLII